MSKYRYRTSTVPKNAHPLVQKLYQLMIDQQVSRQAIHDKTGLSLITLQTWRRNNRQPETFRGRLAPARP